jgi:hypothetical protein
VRSSFSSYMHKAPYHSAYEGAVAGLQKLLSLVRQLPTDCFDIQAYMFRTICDFMEQGGTWLTRESLIIEEMYTRICEENGPADPALQRHCLGHGGLASRLWWGS